MKKSFVRAVRYDVTNHVNDWHHTHNVKYLPFIIFRLLFRLLGIVSKVFVVQLVVEFFLLACFSCRNFPFEHVGGCEANKNHSVMGVSGIHNMC